MEYFVRAQFAGYPHVSGPFLGSQEAYAIASNFAQRDGCESVLILTRDQLSDFSNEFSASLVLRVFSPGGE